MGCDTPKCIPVPFHNRVSIHAPAWGATPLPRPSACRAKSFKPRTRVGCDTAKPPDGAVTVGFNPRTRVGCDGASRRKREVLCRFQSTHPRGVRRQGYCAADPAAQVSIHAPAWGATRIWSGKPPAVSSSFNPRTRVGCDIGTTQGSLTQVGFNPRTRVGCDAMASHSQVWRDWFQSTHPRGVRHVDELVKAGAEVVSIHAPAWGATWKCGSKWGAVFCFNPRTRVGCDVTRSRYRRHALVSIHAPAWGATRGGLLGHAGQPVSIHAPAWGATFEGMTVTCDNDEFQSTHPRGVRHGAPGKAGPNGRGFNPRTRVGCDAASRRVAARDRASFNPRTRVGCDQSFFFRQNINNTRFNPRTRVGCDGKLRQACEAALLVSIHAPAWGATSGLLC